MLTARLTRLKALCANEKKTRKFQRKRRATATTADRKGSHELRLAIRVLVSAEGGGNEYTAFDHRLPSQWAAKDRRRKKAKHTRSVQPPGILTVRIARVTNFVWAVRCVLRSSCSDDGLRSTSAPARKSTP